MERTARSVRLSQPALLWCRSQVSACVRVCVRVCMRACVRDVCACVRVCMHACMRACVMCVRAAYKWVCIQARMRTYDQECVCTPCVCVYKHTSVRECKRVRAYMRRGMDGEGMVGGLTAVSAVIGAAEAPAVEYAAMHACVRMRVHLCVRARVRACARARLTKSQILDGEYERKGSS